MKVIIHNAINIDGKNAGFNIDMESFYSMTSKLHEDVILAGSGTIMNTDHVPDKMSDFCASIPKPDDRRPALAIIDTMGRVDCWKSLIESGYWKEFYAVISKKTDPAYFSKLAKIGVLPIVAGELKVDLKLVVEILDKELGFEVCRLDSEGALNGLMLDLNLVDEVSLVVIPSLTNGEGDSFAINRRMKNFGLIEGRPLDNGVVWLRYERRISNVSDMEYLDFSSILSKVTTSHGLQHHR